MSITHLGRAYSNFEQLIIHDEEIDMELTKYPCCGSWVGSSQKSAILRSQAGGPLTHKAIFAENAASEK